MGAATLTTVEQFAQMQTAETEDYELMEGEVVPWSSGTPLHNKLRDQAGDILRSYFRQNRIGDAIAGIDCRIHSQTVRRPDLSIFLGDNSRSFDMNVIPVPFAPDIAVEILSPSETAIGVNRKVPDYLSGGSREVWILDNTNGELFVHTEKSLRALRADDVLESPLLPGFSQTVGEFLVTV